MPYQIAPRPPMTDALAARCARAVHVLRPDGTVLVGGRACLFVLGELGWPRLAGVLGVPPLVWLVEGSYRLVAVSRGLFPQTVGPWIWWAACGSALAAAGLLLVVNARLSALHKEVERLRARAAALQGELAEREETLRFLSDSRVRHVTLAGLPASPGATGWLLWNPATREGLLLTRGLPQPPSDRAYELWALAGAEAVAAGIFTVDTQGRALLRLPPLPESKAFGGFAVTLEPAGGAPGPTGAMHLLGSL